MGPGDVLQHPLDHQLRTAVGRHRLQRFILCHGILLRVAIDRRRGREDEALDAGVDRRLKQRARLRRIVEIVDQRPGHRFRHHYFCGEMDDFLDAVLGDGLGDEILVAEISHDKRDTFGNRPPKACREIIENDDLFAAIQEFQNHMAADIASPTRHQYRHGQCSFTPFPHPKLTG